MAGVNVHIFCTAKAHSYAQHPLPLQRLPSIVLFRPNPFPYKPFSIPIRPPPTNPLSPQHSNDPFPTPDLRLSSPSEGIQGFRVAEIRNGGQLLAEETRLQTD